MITVHKLTLVVELYSLVGHHMLLTLTHTWCHMCVHWDKYKLADTHIHQARVK